MARRRLAPTLESNSTVTRLSMMPVDPVTEEALAVRAIDGDIPSTVIEIPVDPNEPVDVSHVPSEAAQATIDAVWNLLVPEGHLRNVIPSAELAIPRLRRFLYTLAVAHDMLPSTFDIIGIRSVDRESHGTGGFTDLYHGKLDGSLVVLKRVRLEQNDESARGAFMKKLCFESLRWTQLDHEHIVPFLGICGVSFPETICMVLPWMEQGNVRHRTEVLRQNGRLTGDRFVTIVNRWLHQVTLGLVFLHSEGIVHGDLHGGNILIDQEENARLTDYGQGLMADETPRNYASKQGGGAYQYRAPELHDPEVFGMVLGKPTTASDIYAFACVCVELYSQRTPYEGVSYFTVCKDVVDGKRPSRPKTQDGYDMVDSVWELTTRCWAQKPSDRPRTKRVAGELGAIASGSRLPPREMPVIAMAAEDLSLEYDVGSTPLQVAPGQGAEARLSRLQALDGPSHTTQATEKAVYRPRRDYPDVQHDGRCCCYIA